MTANDLIRDNLELVATAAPDLTARFYERLFRLHPALQGLFGRRSEEAQNGVPGAYAHGVDAGRWVIREVLAPTHAAGAPCDQDLAHTLGLVQGPGEHEAGAGRLAGTAGTTPGKHQIG